MEAFPDFTPFPRIQKVIDGVKKIALLGARTELCLSEHKRGAAEMLDAQLYDQPQLDFGYDDMGNYLTNQAGEA